MHCNLKYKVSTTVFKKHETIVYLSQNRESVAASLMSGVATEQDYEVTDMQSLLDRAKAAIQDPEFRGVTAE